MEVQSVMKSEPDTRPANKTTLINSVINAVWSDHDQRIYVSIRRGDESRRSVSGQSKKTFWLLEEY